MNMMEVCPSCGEVAYQPSKRDRSLPQHRRFFGCIAVAFKNWPEGHRFTPEDSEHLRAWLICQSGKDWRDCETVEVPDFITTDPARAAAVIAGGVHGAIRKFEGRHTFIRPHPEGLAVAVYAPKSVRIYGPERMSHEKFNALSTAVDEVLKAEGFDPDQLYSEMEGAA